MPMTTFDSAAYLVASCFHKLEKCFFVGPPAVPSPMTAPF